MANASIWRCGNGSGDWRMSAVERLDDLDVSIALPRDTTMSIISAAQPLEVAAPRLKSEDPKEG
jgi:hypothetical protein